MIVLLLCVLHTPCNVLLILLSIIANNYYNDNIYVSCKCSGHLMLNSGSRIMCRFAIGGTQMVMEDSVEEEQLNCCVLPWDLILTSIEMTPIIEAVVVECHGCCLFLMMLLSGSVMSSFAISGIQMVMVVSVVLEKGDSFVLTPTSGQHTTEMIQIIEEEAVRWHGSCVLIFLELKRLMIV